MGNMPLVSAVMIFYNEERFIEEAIESVFAQTYQDWELLLVDDGSSDRSTAIARNTAQKWPGKVCYLDHPGHENRGMSASRNLGLAHAKGEYLAFLDADDVWLPGKLERQLATLESQPEAAMAYGPTQWWYSWTGKPEDRQQDYIHELGVAPNTLIEPPELVTRFLQKEGISPCTCSVLIRRRALEQAGGFEESFKGLYEDQVFFSKLCLQSHVYITQECLARYRQHSNSNYSRTQGTGQYDQARRKFLHWLKNYLMSQDIQDSKLSRALEREMKPPSWDKLLSRAQQGLPGKVSRKVRRLRSHWPGLPLIRQLRCLQFRRLQPLGDGAQSGTPIVRYYWDQFLQAHREDIRGTALEIGTISTIRQYGGPEVSSADAIDFSAHSPEITVVADLTRADDVPSNRYDCFINQFTMHLIYDVEAALYHSIRILKPGGVLLINFPCVDYYFPRGLDMGTGEPLYMYWWFTPLLVENLLRGSGLGGEDYSLDIYGNLFSRISYQMNLPAEELTRHELNFRDPGHPLLICARVVKPANWLAQEPLHRKVWHPEIEPARWNPETGHYAQ